MKSNHTIMNYRHIKAETDNPTINSVMGLKEWCLIILLSIVWGGSFFFAKVSVFVETVSIQNFLIIVQVATRIKKPSVEPSTPQAAIAMKRNLLF